MQEEGSELRTWGDSCSVSEGGKICKSENVRELEGIAEDGDNR